MNMHHGARAAAPVETHRMYFDGAGQEYFRVWLGNLLLGIVTLGLYMPWAGRRNARYFWGRLEVAGGQLAFTLPLRHLAPGVALLLGLCAAYPFSAFAGHLQIPMLLALGALLLLPWLWGRAARMRLGHTRWRGLSPCLRASWGEIYAAAWPLFALALLWAAVGLALANLAPGLHPPERGSPALRVVALLTLAGLLTPVWLARLNFNWQRLKVRRAQLGTEVGYWRLGFSPFLRAALASTGVFLLTLLTVAVCGGLAARFGLLPSWQGGAAPAPFLVLLLVLAGALVLAPALAYHDARTFQLIWNHIGMGRIARFRCSLRIRDYFWLRMRNALLSALTLGLYLPFSRVQQWRMKTLSVTLHLRGEADELADTLARQHAAFFGAAAAARARRLQLLEAEAD